ncbi:MAG: hypothetical protein HZB38_13465 [Planctomycetes bacterium]|nr:hypothetical protein [Planctomycetota bacterium]
MDRTAAVVLLAHGGTIFDGLFFDDYWHRVTLRNASWTWSELTETATFDLPGPLANLWWQEHPLQWRYARTIAMALMKLEQQLCGGDPRGVHAFALLWHWLAALGVYAIGTWALQRRPLAFVAAALFALHPHAVFTLGWTAARNALISGVFFFAAFHLYGLASLVGRRLQDSYCTKRVLLTWLVWLLALFSRETAISFPMLLPVLDFLVGGWAAVRQRLVVYGFFGLTAAAYLYWRLFVFPIAPPPEIYFTTPTGLGYFAWAAGKLLHMLFSHIVYTPMFLGLGTGAPTGGAWLEYAVMAAAVAILVGGYLRLARGQRPRWVRLWWMTAAFLPVIPVFVMPHLVYLAAPAFALAVASALAVLGRRRQTAVTAAVLGIALWSTVIYRYCWRGIVRSEQLVYADILSSTPAAELAAAGPQRPKLFFMNLPIAGIYSTVAMRDAWNRPDAAGYVLAFAPHALVMPYECTVTQLNAREFELEIEAGGAYFSGLSGRMFIDGMRGGKALRTGDVMTGPEFDVTIVDCDETGVRRLKYTFQHPLDSSGYYFYVTTPDRPAARLRFSDSGAALDPPAPRSDEFTAWLRERDIYFRILDFVRRFVKSDLYLTSD